MKALITGGGGQLASDLVALLGSSAIAFTSAELDITDQRQLGKAIELVQPDVVVNCAAFHNVALCERERERAWEVNVEAVRALALRSKRLVHISTNYVFDGRDPEPYRESDPPSPRSVYALTKLAGEYATLAYCDHALVVRTAGLYGMQGSASKGGNFVQRVIARARDQGMLRMVSDQYVQPTFTVDLAAAIVQALELEVDGVIHLTASGACSWFEFTQAVMDRAGIDVQIEPVSTSLAAGDIDRPLNGVLARPRASALGIPELRHWATALGDYMQRSGLAATAISMGD